MDKVLITKDKEQFEKSLQWIKNCSFEDSYCIGDKHETLQ